MQITLNEDEIKDAIVGYVSKQINISDTQRVEVDLRAGRGDNGYTATLEIRPALAAQAAPPKMVTRSTGTDIASHIAARVEEDAKDPSPAEEAPAPKLRGLKLATTKTAPKEAPEPDQVEDELVASDVEATAVDDNIGADPVTEPGPVDDPIPVAEDHPALVKPVLKTRSIFNVGK